MSKYDFRVSWQQLCVICNNNNIFFFFNPAEIWLDWLKDEIRLTEEEPNREKVYELFEKAIKDYICEFIWTAVTAVCLTSSLHRILTFSFMSLYPGPDIWLEYAQYSIGGMGSPGGIDKVRSIFERAVTAVGLHMTKGQTVWEAYREFENAILSTVQVCVSITRRDYISGRTCFCGCWLHKHASRRFILNDASTLTSRLEI